MINMVSISSYISKLRSKLTARSKLFFSFAAIGIISIIHGAEPLIFIAVIPLFAYIKNVPKISKKQVYKDFYISGFIFCIIAFTFIWQMASRNWILAIPLWFTIIAQILAILYSASLCAVSFLLFAWLLLKLPQRLRLIAIVLLWPLTELLRSYLFAIISYGPGASLTPNYNFGSLAVAASGTPLVFSARFVGFFGLSALVVLINLCIYQLRHKEWRWSLGVIAIAAITYVGWARGQYSGSRSLNIAWVHLNEKESLKDWEDWQKLPNNLDLLILPEYSEIESNKSFRQLMAKLSSNGVGITSISEGYSPDATNTLVYMNNKGEYISKQPKTTLIPTGEFLPYILKLSFWLIGQDRLVDSFKISQQIQKGDQPEVIYKTDNLKTGTLVCSGAVSPYKYHSLAAQGADVLVNTASLSFLHPKSVYHIQGRNMARFHAVSNTKPFIQSSRSGESYYYDKQGSVHFLYTESKTKTFSTSINY